MTQKTQNTTNHSDRNLTIDFDLKQFNTNFLKAESQQKQKNSVEESEKITIISTLKKIFNLILNKVNPLPFILGSLEIQYIFSIFLIILGLFLFIIHIFIYN
jgi:hypothetical protein